MQQLATRGVQFRPALEVLTLVLDKLDQRQFFDRIGLPNPRYTSLEGGESPDTLMARASAIGFPLVMKTRRLGYDGYGTFMVADPQQLQTVLESNRKGSGFAGGIRPLPERASGDGGAVGRGRGSRISHG